MSLLSLESVSLRTKAGKSLAGPLNIDLGHGDFLVIRGPNGSGKTTLLRAILGDKQLYSGQIRWNINPERIAYLPQAQNLDFLLPLSLGDALNLGADREVSSEEACSFGLLEARHLSLSWNQASGGEQKRALLSRVLLADPRVIVLDEPFNHLDPESRHTIITALKSFLSRTGERLVIVVSHDPVPEFSAASIKSRELTL